MFRTMQAHGAYGRSANMADWLSGKDFYSLEHTRYFSVRDILALRRDGIIEIQFVGFPTCITLFTVKL